MIILNDTQLKRLYSVFDFEDYETIENATIESDRGGFMEINYYDSKDGIYGCYKPYFEKHSAEDKSKLRFILNGIKLERE